MPVMTGSNNIFLIGPMGSGKTAVGRQLARLLDRPFFDSDHEIEQRTGADIALIFEREGEAGFRRRERETIASLTRAIAAWCWRPAAARCSMPRTVAISPSAAGWCTWRPRWRSRSSAPGARGTGRCSPAWIRTRRLEELMSMREPLYREIADYTATTTRKRVGVVAEVIVQAYRRAHANA